MILRMTYSVPISFRRVENRGSRRPITITERRHTRADRVIVVPRGRRALLDCAGERS